MQNDCTGPSSGHSNKSCPRNKGSQITGAKTRYSNPFQRFKHIEIRRHLAQSAQKDEKDQSLASSQAQEFAGYNKYKHIGLGRRFLRSD